MFKLELSGVLNQEEPNVDSAMEAVFSVFPKASFSLWNDSQTETWMDVFNGPRNVGKIVEGV